MIGYYTFGVESRRGILLSTKQAEACNRFIKSFSDGQNIFFDYYGRDWEINDPIPLPFGNEGQLRNEEELQVYNFSFMPWAKRQYFIRRIFFRPIRESDVMNDFLVRRF